MHSDPTQQLQHGIMAIFYDTISRFPPPYAAGQLDLAPDCAYRMGDYLINLGYITPRQLRRALYASNNQHTQLGCALVAHDLVPPHVISAVLLRQFLDRISSTSAIAPQFLGEELLIQERIAPLQLATVLREQLAGFQYGNWTRIGELIVQHHWLDSGTIASTVQQMRHATLN